MWKWTDPNNIHTIILDADSLEEQYLNYPFHNIINNVHVLKVKYINFDNNDYDKNITYYFDISLLLYNIMKSNHCESFSIIAVSNDIVFLKEMMQNHIGTILTRNITEESLNKL